MRATEIKKASTVILLRPKAGGGLEILLTKRPSGMGFLGGAYVFPGGVLREADCSERLLRRCFGLPPAGPKRSCSPEVALGHRVAAIRELYEEVGILLCLSAGGAPTSMKDGPLWRRLEQKRERLLEGSLDFAEFLESENLHSDVGRLMYFSHWLTPAEFAARFDARFYLALLPENQTPVARSPEVSHSLWISPEDSLRRYEAGELPMIFPTFASLRTLANFESLEEVLAEYRRMDE